MCMNFILFQVVDFLLGEGPGKRYALICSACFSHNGMALQDEFEYICMSRMLQN